MPHPSISGISVEGPSSEGFFFYPVCGTDREGEYASGEGPKRPRIYPDGKSHAWSLKYDPHGAGRIVVALDEQTFALDLRESVRKIGAHFDRFGIVTTQIDGNGQTIFFDDLVYSGR